MIINQTAPNDRGFTFIELLASIILIGGALIGFLGIIANDMRTIRFNSRDFLLRSAAQAELDRWARVLGNDGTGTNDGVDSLPDCTQPQALSAAELQAYGLEAIPTVQGFRCADRFDTTAGSQDIYPDVRRLTVMFRADYENSGTWKEWTLVTLVAPGGVDKT